MNAELTFHMLCQWSQAVQAARRTIHFVGNGASACMASHMAVDWTKNAGTRSLAYNDFAFLTALGNDLGKYLSNPSYG
jgi:D-sedoheptulose 7-phosphate isomerase